MSDSNDFTKWIVGGVATFVGAIFVSVSLWLGSTVNALSAQVAGLQGTNANLSKQADKRDELLRKVSEQLQQVAVEQAKRSGNDAAVGILSKVVEDLQKRVTRLEEKSK